MSTGRKSERGKGPGGRSGALFTRGYGESLLAAAVVLMVGMMIVPLPTPLLDVLIAGNIALGVVMLLIGMYIPNGLAFASMPTVLLVTTLYRLALNISSTRLILLQAYAGEVIQSFGDYVVRGNYAVGAVIFFILTVVQYLVIARGSERVAEVGARFTLDAMPGKQLSIDADLRSGAVDAEGAQQRRRLLEREGQFYGAMDGAMKFVKGDAIAGMIITAVNIMAGVGIGVGMMGMPLEQSLRVYGLLTVGDGLVSQIPALLICTSAGLVVTRVASESEQGSLGADIGAQLFGNPRVLAIGAGFLAFLALVPGLPALPFLVLSALLGVTARALHLAGRARPSGARRPGAAGDGEAALSEPEAASVELGSGLGRLLVEDPIGERAFDDAIEQERQALHRELGVVLPSVSISVSGRLQDDAYALALLELPLARGRINGAKSLALAPGERLQELGVSAEPARDPATGEPACWIAPRSRAALETEAVTVLAPIEIIARHLRAAVEHRAQDLVGIQEVQGMLDRLERREPALVRSVVPNTVSLPVLTAVLQRLLEERVSIRPLRDILQALSLHAHGRTDPDELAELVRSGLKRQITHRYARGGELAVHRLDPALEEAIRDAVHRNESGTTYLALAPGLARDIVAAVSEACSSTNGSAPAVVLAASDVRRHLRRLIASELPEVVVLGVSELSPEVTVKPLEPARI